MGFFDKIKDFFGDLLLGEEKHPPVPQTPEAARKYLDSVIPPRPDDREAIRFLRQQGSITRTLQRIEELAPGFLTTSPYSNKVWPQFAVGANPDYPDIYTLQNRFLVDYFSQNERLAYLYQRHTDPMGLAAKIVEQDLRRHGGLLHWGKNILSDTVGRGIGTIFHWFNKYNSWLETDAPWTTLADKLGLWSASQLLEEAGGDPILKREIAKYRFEIGGLNLYDSARGLFGLGRFFGLDGPDQPYAERVKQAIRDIRARGLSGQVAADAFEEWMSKNPAGPAGIIGEIFFATLMDPLFFLTMPLGATGILGRTAAVLGVGKGPTLLGKMISPVTRALGIGEEGIRISRLFRVFPGAPGRQLVKDGAFMLEQVLKMDEAVYRTHTITSAPVGPLRWLFERTPSRFGSEVATRLKPVVLSISKTKHPILDPIQYQKLVTQYGEELGERLYQLQARASRLQALDRFLKTGEYSDILRDFVGPEILNEPTIARFHALYKRSEDVSWLSGRLSPDEDLLSGIFNAAGELKPEALRILEALPAGVDETYLWTGVVEQLGGMAERLQMGLFPTKLLKRWLPLVAMQKMWLGIFTLGRPGFAVLNAANNTFTFLWDTMLRRDWTLGRKAEAIKLLAQSMFGEVSRVFPGGGRSTTAMEKIARSVGLDTAAIEALATDISSLYDVLGRGRLSVQAVIKAGVKDDLLEREVNHVVRTLTRFHTQPLKERHAFRWRDLLAAPVTVATGLDRAVRRATFYANLAEASHLALQSERLVPWGVVPDIARVLREAGIADDEALRIEGVILDQVRTHLRTDGAIDPNTLRQVWSNAIREALEGRPSASLLMERFLQERGLTGEALVFGSKIHDPNLVKLSRAIDQLSEEVRAAMTEDELQAALRNFELGLSKVISDTNFLDRYLAYLSRHTPASIVRPANNYLEALEMTGQQVVDNHVRYIHGVSHLLNSQVPATAINVNLFREFNKAATEVAEDLLRLQGVTQLYYKPKVTAAELEAAWDAYRKTSDAAFEKFVQATRGFMENYVDDPAIRKTLDEVLEAMGQARGRHWGIVMETRSKVRGLKDEKAIAAAWTAAGEKVRAVFDEFWKTVPKAFELEAKVPVNDMFPTLSSVIAMNTDEFLSWVIRRYKSFPEFRALIDSSPVRSGVAGRSLRSLLTQKSLSPEDIGELERLLSSQKWAVFMPSAPPEKIEEVNAVLIKVGAAIKSRFHVTPIRLKNAAGLETLFVPGIDPGLVPEVMKTFNVGSAYTPVGRFILAPEKPEGVILATMKPSEKLTVIADPERLARHLTGQEKLKGRSVEVFLSGKRPVFGVMMPSRPQIAESVPFLTKPETPLMRLLHDDLFSQFMSKYEVARNQIIRNAAWKTDFTMLNYNNQYGIDAILQMVAPYEFFPTRTVAHWAMRFWQNPAYAGLLLRTILAPRAYAQNYGIPGGAAAPERVEWAIPIPLPGLGEALNRLGLQSGKFNFFGWYWVDPMAILFPLTNYRDTFDDEKKRGTPFGMIADWFQQHTPLGISPFAVMVGSATGLLDEQAWNQTMFRGGPFGVPLNQWARATLSWLHTGDDLGMIPEEEKDLYTDRGHFSKNWLARTLGSATRWVGKAFGFGEQRFDDYLAERAIASLLASGDIPGATKEEQVHNALTAIYTHEGPVWQLGVKAANQEKFLREFTGWIGFRTVGMLEGEPIQLGLRRLYAEARESADPLAVDRFFEKFPEYRVRQIVVRGVDDPEEARKAAATELFFRDRERLVNGQFDDPIKKVEDQLAELRRLPQTEDVRDQIAILNRNLRILREERERWMQMVELAYPDREAELSLNRPPRNRALSRWREKWYDEIADPLPGETEEEHNARKVAFLRQLASLDPEEAMLRWEQVNKEYFAIRVQYGLAKSEAMRKRDFDEVDRLDREEEVKLRRVHEQAEKLVTANDFLLMLVYDNREETPEEREFKNADLLFDIWMALVGDSSPLTGRQKRAVSAYFSSLPIMQKHFHTYTLDISELNAEQLYALIRRRAIWRKFYDLGEADAQLTYITAVQDELNAANELLGLPPVTVIDVRRAPEPFPDTLPYRRALAMLMSTGNPALQEELAPLAVPDVDTLLSMDPEVVNKVLSALSPSERSEIERYLKRKRLAQSPGP